MRPNPEADEFLLEHIEESIDRIVEYTKGNRATFDASRMTQDLFHAKPGLNGPAPLFRDSSQRL